MTYKKNPLYIFDIVEIQNFEAKEENIHTPRDVVSKGNELIFLVKVMMKVTLCFSKKQLPWQT